jgi:hypothetical protein
MKFKDLAANQGFFRGKSQLVWTKAAAPFTVYGDMKNQNAAAYAEPHGPWHYDRVDDEEEVRLQPTLSEFVASRKLVQDIGAELADDTMSGPGFVYLESFWIRVELDGSVYTEVKAAGAYTGYSLDAAEKFLYKHVKGEI